jgi:hypothetical protein
VTHPNRPGRELLASIAGLRRQPHVEGVDVSGLEAGKSSLPETGADVFVSQPAIVPDRGGSDRLRFRFEPTVEKIAEGACGRSRMSALVYLGHESSQRLFGVFLGAMDSALGVSLPAGSRVSSNENAQAPRLGTSLL